MKKYSNKDLKLIAETLNVLLEDSDKTNGIRINTFHFSRFYNDTHYIDFKEKGANCFKIYKKYKNWKPTNEILIK